MKTYATILFLLCILTSASSQKDSTKNSQRKYEFGARSGFYFTSYSSGFNYFAYLTASKGIHELAIGPSLGRSPTFYYPFYANSDRTTGLNGIDLSYRI